MEKVILIGAGGHSKVIQDSLNQMRDLELYAILDDAFRQTIEKDGIMYAPTDFLNTINRSDYKFCLAIGSNSVRKKLFGTLNIPLTRYLSVIHPHATISPSARIGHGTVVMAGVVINADATIGNHCIINTGSVVEHDNRVGDFAHISPNATLAGSVAVLEGAHVGAGATVIQGMRIGSWSTIGAGAVVVKNVESNVIAAGVPAQVIKRNETMNEMSGLDEARS
ncbi:acetyltransferase [Pueribacillus theae]|uniref:Acetyltransferase n=1 Tax=Pueribacillus theae TaxID=2171751 RepID=A0A2U1K549_9BACI|nr:acetyltransferase [Pueribacillus theae]PWA12646.1 acetyltransferase [Pueribacillus theae]